MTVESNRELLAVQKDDESAGQVAHISKFTLKDKQTGSPEEKSNVTIATIGIKDGKMVLTELAEIST